MMDIKRAIDKLPESASMKMGRLAREMDNKEKIINLGIGDPYFTTPKKIINSAYKFMLSGKTHYVDAQGIVELRSKTSDYLKKRFNINYSAEQIIITPGSKQGIYYSLLLWVRLGVKVGLFEPSWLGYVPAIKLANGRPVFFKLDNGVFTEKVVKRIKKSHIHLVIINTPNNPTGKVWRRKELDLLVNCCKKKKIRIIADEVYNEIVYENKFHSLGNYNKTYSEIIVAGSFSKTLAMTGWRLGYLCFKDKKMMERFVKLQQIIATCPSSFSQYAVADTLEKCRREIAEMKKMFKENRDLLFTTLKGTKLEPVLPQGTFYMWVNVKEDGEKFTEKLLKKLKIVVVPGKDYARDTNNFIRISFGVSKEKIKEACRRFKNEFKK